MRAGSVPSSIRASSRSVRIRVLPVPAEAETQTEAAGSSALLPHVAAVARLENELELVHRPASLSSRR